MPCTGMTLRDATSSDASSIAAISIEVWLGTYLKAGVNAFFADFALESFTPNKIRAQIDDPAQRLIVSCNSEGIDGFIRLHISSPDPVTGTCQTEIATFYIQPRHHGKGIGKALLSAALQHCRTKGAKAVWLATNAQNDPAIGFYLAQGFQQIGETQFRIDDSAYLNNVYRLSVPPT